MQTRLPRAAVGATPGGFVARIVAVGMIDRRSEEGLASTDQYRHLNQPVWRHARDRTWPEYRQAADPRVVGCAALRKFDEMIELMNQSVIDKADWDRMCAVPLTSYAQMSQGLGC